MSKDQTIINEIAELFSDPVNLQNDMTEACELMKAHIHKKYVDRMLKLVESCEAGISSNPPDEVRLLMALKPFTAADSHSKIDNFIGALQKYNTMRELKNKLVSAELPNDIKIASQSINQSLHDDGVYDIDEGCVVAGRGNAQGFGQMPGLLMMMAMLGGNKQRN